MPGRFPAVSGLPAGSPIGTVPRELVGQGDFSEPGPGCCATHYT